MIMDRNIHMKGENRSSSIPAQFYMRRSIKRAGGLVNHPLLPVTEL